MRNQLETKTESYGDQLSEACNQVELVADENTPIANAGEQCLEMATAYLQDGNHFQSEGDLPNALASYAYGYGWLDAAVRIGVLEIKPGHADLFTR